MTNLSSENQFSDLELQKAYFIWCQKTKLDLVDDRIKRLLNIEAPIERNWLKLARESQMHSMDRVAKRMGVSKNAYFQLEQSELSEKISIKSLKNAAESLDCELVYFIRPKNKKLFSYSLWQMLLKVCLKAPRFRNLPSGRKPMALALLALETLKKPQFRKDNGLNQIWKN